MKNRRKQVGWVVINLPVLALNKHIWWISFEHSLIQKMHLSYHGIAPCLFNLTADIDSYRKKH